MLRESIDIRRFSLPISKNITYRRSFYLSLVERDRLACFTRRNSWYSHIRIHTHIHIYTSAGSVPFRLHLLCLLPRWEKYCSAILFASDRILIGISYFFPRNIAHKSSLCKLLTTTLARIRHSLIDREISRWTNTRPHGNSTRRGVGKWKIHPFTRFRRATYWERVGYWPNAGCRVRQADSRKEETVRSSVYVMTYGGERRVREGESGRDEEEERRQSWGAEGCQRVERNGDGGAGGDKAPQCGAVDTTTTTHPRPLFEDLSLHLGLPTPVLLSFAPLLFPSLLCLPLFFYISE